MDHPISKLMEFSNSGKNNDIIKTTKKAKKTYILPPMLEQISTDEGKLYLCFESKDPMHTEAD